MQNENKENYQRPKNIKSSDFNDSALESVCVSKPQKDLNKK